MLDTTRIRVRYIRPVARGRALFGSLVKYGSTWTPSADSSMWISFSGDVDIDGHRLKAGDYSVWAFPDTARWTLAFNKRPLNHHTRYPGESEDALRVLAKVDSLPHVETLTIDFPVVDGRNAVLRIHWGTVAVSIPVKEPQ